MEGGVVSYSVVRICSKIPLSTENSDYYENSDFTKGHYTWRYVGIEGLAAENMERFKVYIAGYRKSILYGTMYLD